MYLEEVFCKSFNFLLLLSVCDFSLFFFLFTEMKKKKPTKNNFLLVQIDVEIQTEKKNIVLPHKTGFRSSQFKWDKLKIRAK